MLTVILPVYNAISFLPSWFESFNRCVNLDQLALIVVDNGSTDGTQEYVRHRLRSHRDKFFQNDENIGPLGSVRKGLDTTTTEFVCYLPADDAMHPRAFLHAINGLVTRPECVFAFGKSSMRFYSEGTLVGERERVCPYVSPGVYDGNALRQLFINYPTDVAVIRTSSLRAVGGYFGNSIRWNAFLQAKGKVYFTGEPCLVSGKFGSNLSGQLGLSGKTGAQSVQEIGSVLTNECFSDVERFCAMLLTTAVFAGSSVFSVLTTIAKDSGDRGYAQFLAVNSENIFVELFKVLAGQFRFSRDSLFDNSQPRTHAGNIYCTREEFFALRDFVVARGLAAELKIRPDTDWAFNG
jgi:hypothetical protein